MSEAKHAPLRWSYYHGSGEPLSRTTSMMLIARRPRRERHAVTERSTRRKTDELTETANTEMPDNAQIVRKV